MDCDRDFYLQLTHRPHRMPRIYMYVYVCMFMYVCFRYLDNIPEDVIAELNIPTAAPLVYELDDDLKPIPQKDAIAPLSGRYPGNQDDIRARIQGVKVRVSRSCFCELPA